MCIYVFERGSEYLFLYRCVSYACVRVRMCVHMMCIYDTHGVNSK